MTINFENIITKAYEILIIQKDLSFPLDIFNLKIKDNIKIISYSMLAKINSCTYNDILKISDNADAYKFENKGIILIAYNDKVTSKNRIRWSIAHEYGHIVLEHKSQSAQNEIEANFFAANLLLPRCILKELLNKRDYLTLDYLQSRFSISKEASEKFFKNMNSRGFNYFSNEYDDIIIAKAEKFIKNETKNSKRMFDNYNDDMQNARDKWLYE